MEVAYIYIYIYVCVCFSITGYRISNFVAGPNHRADAQTHLRLIQLFDPVLRGLAWLQTRPWLGLDAWLVNLAVYINWNWIAHPLITLLPKSLRWSAPSPRLDDSPQDRPHRPAARHPICARPPLPRPALGVIRSTPPSSTVNRHRSCIWRRASYL